MDVTNNVMRLSEDDICCQLKRICRIGDSITNSAADEAIGILTSQSRDEWARCRDKLLQGMNNEKCNVLVLKSRYLF